MTSRYAKHNYTSLMFMDAQQINPNAGRLEDRALCKGQSRCRKKCRVACRISYQEEINGTC